MCSFIHIWCFLQSYFHCWMRLVSPLPVNSVVILPIIINLNVFGTDNYWESRCFPSILKCFPSSPLWVLLSFCYVLHTTFSGFHHDLLYWWNNRAVISFENHLIYTNYSLKSGSLFLAFKIWTTHQNFIKHKLFPCHSYRWNTNTIIHILAFSVFSSGNTTP